MDIPLFRFFRRHFYFSNIIRGKTDYKVLSNRILSLNSRTTIEDLVTELSKSLKDILNYELFAFVILENSHLNIWSDPLLSKSSLLDIISKDFPGADIDAINYIAQGDENVIALFFKKPESVTAHHLTLETGRACLYLIHEKKDSQKLTDAADILIRTFETTLSNIMKIRQLERASSIDPLTGCYNRRAFRTELGHNISNAQRYGRALSLFMFDVDHFKKINDGYGHLFGDEVLKTISETTLAFIRKGDYLARFGGEEFVVVLPETPLRAAVDIAHRLKKRIDRITFNTPAQEPLKVTASYGVSSLGEDDDMESLIARADTMLYLAKTHGRDRVMPPMEDLDVKSVSV